MLKAQLELEKFRWLMIMLVPALAVSLNLIMFGSAYWSQWDTLLISSLLMLVGIALLSAIQIFIANLMRSRQTGDQRLIRRIMMAACIHFPVTGLFVSGYILLYDRFSLFQYQFSQTDLNRGLLAGIVCDIVGIAMNEGIYSYHKWRETKLEAEQLSKEKLRTQLNSLLQQINPHFLFNSLNTLSALIDENPQSAQKYLSDLSKVYRYLLRTNENELTTLASEINFIDSYFHLLQTRFGKGVVLRKNISPDDHNKLLPPLTLQLLVENAVKHNTVGKNNPLFIEIFIAGNFLTVRNTLQKKIIKVESNKVGLTNIAEKYRLINKSAIEIVEADGYFSVSVPLIENGV